MLVIASVSDTSMLVVSATDVVRARRRWLTSEAISHFDRPGRCTASGWA
ncbi:hypothetical protein [Novosphingobium sp. MD-1]|nr:hypothetical protein [Novosphingobium sp. MD-1]